MEWHGEEDIVIYIKSLLITRLGSENTSGFNLTKW